MKVEGRIDAELLLQTADWAWSRVLDGLPGWDTAEELAGPVPGDSESVEARIDELIRSQKRKAFATGMLGKLGEALPLSIPVPAGLAVSLFLRLRLVAAIARLRGYVPRDDRVKALCMACLCRVPVSEMLWKAGTGIGLEVTPVTLRHISPQVAEGLRREIGARLEARLGGKRLWGMGKALPLLGCLLRGVSDSLAMASVGAQARKTLNPVPSLGQQ